MSGGDWKEGMGRGLQEDENPLAVEMWGLFFALIIMSQRFSLFLSTPYILPAHRRLPKPDLLQPLELSLVEHNSATPYRL